MLDIARGSANAIDPLVKSTIVRAVILVVLADGVLTFMDALIKGLTPRYSALQISCLRFAFGSIVAVAMWGIVRPALPSRASITANSLRSIVIAITATAFFFALGRLPFANCAVLTFLSPLFIALFGAAFLKEELSPRIGLALGVGFIGMLIMVAGDVSFADMSGSAWAGVAAAVLAAITYALNVIILRARATQDPVPTIVLFQNIGPAVILAIPAALVWQPLSQADTIMFALIGCLGVGGHYLLAEAFALAPAATLAPVGYVVLIWAAIFGVFFFGELPSMAAVAGALFIVLGTWLTQKK
jgi:drug/metabolite transporter (DMT)-like permease